VSLFSAIINGVRHIEQDMESLVSHAFSELEAISINVGGEVGWLVKFLIESGEDPVATIRHLCSRIESMGGDVGSTLEELASGVMTYGLMGFAQKKVEQVISPLEEALNQSTLKAQAVADVHRATLKTMQIR
jgi:hypothetical protein